MTEKPGVALREKSAIQAYLESRGYFDFEAAAVPATNQIFFAKRDGKKYFVKIYNDKNKIFEAGLSRAATEIACYQHLPSEITVHLIEGDAEKGCVVFEKAELSPLDKTAAEISAVAEMYLDKIAPTEAGFLSEVGWDEYEKVCRKAIELEYLKIISDAAAIVQRFTLARTQLLGLDKVFSHHDFNLSNIRRENGRLVVFDFELARRDSALYDMATLFIEVADDEPLRKVVLDKIKQKGIYDEKLFQLMIMRRAIDVLHGLREHPDLAYFIRNKQALEMY